MTVLMMLLLGKVMWRMMVVKREMGEERDERDDRGLRGSEGERGGWGLLKKQNHSHLPLTFYNVNSFCTRGKEHLPS